MAIGTFGKRIFETSDSKVLTFRDFSYQTAARFASHEVLLGKPKTEFLGSGLDSITFTILLRAELGVAVRQELEAWRKMAGRGTVERLMIGKRRLGSARWAVTDCSEAWGVVASGGAILSASLTVTLQEYV